LLELYAYYGFKEMENNHSGIERCHVKWRIKQKQQEYKDEADDCIE
jgi:hypothetical protein